MTLRPARAEDAQAIAIVHRLAVRISLPFLPELHAAEEDLWFVGQKLMVENETWVSEVDGAVVGYIAFRAGWIAHLFVHPDHQGRGLGPTLLAKAMADGAERRLWTFQQNTRARTFYEKRGFTPEEFTDGEGNEEKVPDVRYVWGP